MWSVTTYRLASKYHVNAVFWSTGFTKTWDVNDIVLTKNKKLSDILKWKKKNKLGNIICERFDSDAKRMLKYLYVSSIEDNPTLLINAVSKSLSFKNYVLPLTTKIIHILEASFLFRNVSIENIIILVEVTHLNYWNFPEKNTFPWISCHKMK